MVNEIVRSEPFFETAWSWSSQWIIRRHANESNKRPTACNPSLRASPERIGERSSASLSRGRLGRRTFLRGAGTSLALPWLDAMIPRTVKRGGSRCQAARADGLSLLAQRRDPRRLDAGGDRCELHLVADAWQPLAPVKSEVLVLERLFAKEGVRHGGRRRRSRPIGVDLPDRSPSLQDRRAPNIRAGVSVDQVAAAKIGGRTPLPSLELGIDPGATAGNCDSGYSCAYSSCISWRTPTTPMAKEINPKLVFERMFGTGRLASAGAGPPRLSCARASSISCGTIRLAAQKRLGTTDRRKMDEYFSGIRELELRIELSARHGRSPTSRRARYRPAFPTILKSMSQLMFDLLALAFQTDMTRVATYMFANEGSNRLYPMVGAKDGHHALSHHRNNEETDRPDRGRSTAISSRNTRPSSASSARFARGRGRCLDNCMVFYGSGIWATATRTRTMICRSCWPVAAAARSSPGRHLSCRRKLRSTISSCRCSIASAPAPRRSATARVRSAISTASRTGKAPRRDRTNRRPSRRSPRLPSPGRATVSRHFSSRVWARHRRSAQYFFASRENRRYDELAVVMRRLLWSFVTDSHSRSFAPRSSDLRCFI